MDYDSAVFDYDIIIAGAGAAGLSLAYHLGQAGINQRILLLDREAKQHNDRTWCFWEIGSGPFEEVVYRQWDNIWFHAPNFSRRYAIAPYRYKMIRGSDFYQYMHQWLNHHPNIQVRYGEVESIQNTANGAKVVFAGQTLSAKWVFSSLYQPQNVQAPYHHLLQHFKGWVVQTPNPVFDTQAATFMDFRIEQEGSVRFVYVLPFDAHTALVEYTLFSPQVLSQAEYDTGLRSYLSQHLGISEFSIQHQEFGVIPMTDAPFAPTQTHVIPIGTAGGRTKASTGYTFQRIQQQSAQIVQSLLRFGHPHPPKPRFHRFDWYDSVLLNVLARGRTEGRGVFTALFRSNPAHQVLHFLDERTRFWQDVRLLSSVDIPAFTAAMLDVVSKRLHKSTQRVLRPNPR